MTIRILIADDHPLMREALRYAIEDEEDLQLVGEASNGEEAIQIAQQTTPDIILLDLLMPVLDGLSTINELITADPEVHILVFTSSQEEDKINSAVESGVLGYLNKDAPRKDLLYAIREVSQGRAYLPPAIAARLLARLRKNKRMPQAEIMVEKLTPREIEVADWVGKGLTNRQIADALTLTEGTVRTHVHNILQKLNLQNRNQLILYALKENSK